MDRKIFGWRDICPIYVPLRNLLEATESNHEKSQPGGVWPIFKPGIFWIQVRNIAG
jgi:hypothetical protein